MKTTLSALTALLLLTACSIDIMESDPVIEAVSVDKQASLPGITCIVQGSYPRISGLESTQVAENINSYIEAHIRKITLANASCPKDLLDLVEEGAELTDTTTVDYTVTLLENDIYSVKLVESQYFEGAAHPNNSILTYTFSLIDGQPITIADLFPEEDIASFIREHIQEGLEAQGIDAEYPSETSNETVKFFMTADSVVLTDIFSTHALQGVEIAIPFTPPSI